MVLERALALIRIVVAVVTGGAPEQFVFTITSDCRVAYVYVTHAFLRTRKST